MDYRTDRLILHYVTEDDLNEVIRTWPSDHHPISEEEAHGVISYLSNNYAKNTKGCIYHLCLAVCGAEDPQTIMGWCGLDGRREICHRRQCARRPDGFRQPHLCRRRP